MTHEEQDELDRVEIIHSMAMSDRPDMAVTGRFLKEFASGFYAFLRKEEKRNQPAKDAEIWAGVIKAMAILASSFSLRGIKDGDRLEAIRLTNDLFADTMVGIAVNYDGAKEKRGGVRHAAADSGQA